MTKSLFSLSFLMLFFLGISDFQGSNFENLRTFTEPSFPDQIIKTEHLFQSDSIDIPEEILFPSKVGEVQFPHRMHVEDFEIKCVDCHHQINAEVLITPHKDYFKSSWIKCQICHKPSGQSTKKIYTCSACHHPNPSSITDETLSSKVVIHKKCWECHEVNTGSEASKMCGFCHTGKKES